MGKALETPYADAIPDISILQLSPPEGAGFEIRPAKSADEISDVLRLRELVYAKEQGWAGSSDELADIFARHDRYSTYFIAYADDRPAGTIRVTLDSELALPGEAFVDLSALRAKGNRLVGTGHFVVAPEFRGKQIGLFLRRKALSFSAIDCLATHMVADIILDSPRKLSVNLEVGLQLTGEPYQDTRFTKEPARCPARGCSVVPLGRSPIRKPSARPRHLYREAHMSCGPW